MSGHLTPGEHAEHTQAVQIPEQERLVRVNHLAVLALASSVSGIEWVTSEQDGIMLAANLQREDQLTVPFPKGSWLGRPGSVATDSGFELKSRIEFQERNSRASRVFPKAFDVPILGDPSPNTLVSSKITIERPSPNIPTVTTIIGLTAVHTVNSIYDGQRFEIVNDAAGPTAFSKVFALLVETSNHTVDYSELEKSIAYNAERLPSNEHSRTHFATPDELGVPMHIIKRAQNNFSVLSAHLDSLANTRSDS